ncbi:MAG: hypothetical protein BJ554DRAFT_7220 [Olpidium bornovanus]|uniref:Uncharacterized protein n=1 Tax=Olpidium bornovanus TaxID=278681 RepID=A0A8H7ZX14_9FUNG|nr:MAG: hypothetical protein BJ554DRAFT_7220 [Olpidium bornovanus]
MPKFFELSVHSEYRELLLTSNWSLSNRDAGGLPREETKSAQTLSSLTTDTPLLPSSRQIPSVLHSLPLTFSWYIGIPEILV